MSVESPAEFEAFFHPAEFANEAILHTIAGDFPLNGIIDTIASVERPGGNKGSGNSPFMMGASEFQQQNWQFLTSYSKILAAGTKTNDTLEVLTGKNAGSYRIKGMPRDGDNCCLMLNKL